MSCVILSVPVPQLKTITEDYITTFYQAKKHPMNKPVSKLASLDFTIKDLLIFYRDFTNSVAKNAANSNCFALASTSCSTTLYGMKSELNRLNSFQNKWTVSYIKPLDMAAAGLFYLGERDCVQCAFCRGVISDWEKNDEPLKEHMQHFPMCPFLLGCEVGNIPISKSNEIKKVQSQHSFAERVHSKNDLPQRFQKIPLYPQMNHVDRRIQTFSNWNSTVVNAAQLAECGFFYSGEGDAVTCFCCGGRLGNWEAGDEPWTEHAKHYPSCAYVKFIKGSGFVASVRPPDIDPSTNLLPCASSATSSDVIEDVNMQVMEEQCRVEPMENLRICEERESIVENKTISKHLCKICMDEGGRVAFLPCGHSLACPKCAVALSFCPMCRAQIKSVVRIYFD